MRAPAFGERWEARRLLALLAALSVATALFTLYAGTAKADSHFFLNVDGVQYSPTQLSGPVRHYETPDTNPTSAFSDRHTWTGNGSEHLPCAGGIHWIDNDNVLTVSHCLDGEGTTTTTVVDDTTTTSVEDTTTTSVDETTTTSVEETTTTSVEDTTTTSVEDTTTTSVEDTTTTSVDDTTTTTSQATTTSTEATTTTSEPSTTTTQPSTTTTEASTTTSQATTSTTEDDPEVLPTVVTAPPDEVDDDELPFTGLDSDVLFAIAVVLFGIGAAALAMTRRLGDDS